MKKSDLYTLLGGLGGAAAAGMAGYAVTGRKRGRLARLRNAILAALGGGLAGGALGRLAHAHMDHVRLAGMARGKADGKPVPGMLYYVDYPDNSIDAGNIPGDMVQKMVGRMKARGWDGKLRIGHSGLLAVDEAGNGTQYDYGLFTDDGPADGKAKVISVKHDLAGKSADEIAELLQRRNSQWGNKVVLYGTKVPDIRVAANYIDGVQSSDSDGFSVVPGGYSCATVARRAFDAARGSGVGHLLDLLWGGTPTSNAPTYGTAKTTFTKESESSGMEKEAIGDGYMGGSMARKRQRAAAKRRAELRERYPFDPRYSSTGTKAMNLLGSIGRGQVVIPGLTIGSPHHNAPIDVRANAPVFIGMTGAGADPDNYDMLQKDGNRYGVKGEMSIAEALSKQMRTGNNTLMFRHFDVDEAARAIRHYHAAGHPVMTFGESYGGPAMWDAVRKSGVRVDRTVAFDPVSWAPVSAPTNSAENIKILPDYTHKFGIGKGKNLTAFAALTAGIGGRHTGHTDNVDKVMNGYNIAFADAHHAANKEPIIRALLGLDTVYDQGGKAPSRLYAYQNGKPDLSGDMSNQYIQAGRQEDATPAVTQSTKPTGGAG